MSEENKSRSKMKAKLKSSLLESSKEDDSNHVVVWLDGKAPEQFNDQPVDIKGTISAPSRFLDKRVGEFYPKTAHALVSKTDGTIVMVINEHTVSEKYTIAGKVEIGKRFQELGINTDKSYTPIELSKKFRLLRSLFPSVAQHSSIVTLLRNFKAKVHSDIDKKDDARGNVNVSLNQAVESNIPESFKMNIPLLEGSDPVEIEVQVLIEIGSGNSFNCYLESIDGADLIEQARIQLVEDEVKKIDDLVTVIYV